MATPAEIEEQVKFEREAISQGLERLHKNTRDLEAKEYASASVYGNASIDTILPLLVKYIEDTTHSRLTRGTGHQFQLIKQYVSQLEILASATIALKITFDKVFSYKDKSNQLVNVCDAIGHAVEDECQMRHYETHAPGLLETLKKNYWHKSIGTQQKIVVIRTLMNRHEVKKWDAWGRANRVKLGGWLLDCIMQCSGWFEKENKREGRKTVQYVVPTPAFMAIKDQVMRDAELFSPLAWPMLIEPNDWTNDRAGGYLLNEVMRGHELVRRGHGGRIQGEKPIEFLNKIQKVAYCLNPFIVEVAEQLEEKGIQVGKFLPITDYDLPPKPFDIAENHEARKSYRRQVAEVLNLKAQEFRKSCRTRMTMESVKRFKGRSKFYIPWSFDYRGRAYPIPASLHHKIQTLEKVC